MVGASVAYHLARAGAPVTLIDGAGSPAAGVTGTSFAWIGDAGGDWPGGAADLRADALADHRRLESEVPGVAVRWTGSLAWGGAEAPGPGRRWIGPDRVAALEPRLRTLPDRAVHTPTDGAVDPVGLTRALVHAARGLGARVVLGSAVSSVATERGRVSGVVSAAGHHAASTVVLAAGTAVPALAEQIGVRVPVGVSPALLVRLAAPPGLVRTIVAGPGFEVRELRHGRLLMTAPMPDDPSPVAVRSAVEDAVERLRAAFRGEVRLLGWGVGARPMPAGGPVVGHLTADRSAYVAVLHSAVTLAPTVGRLVAREIVTGRDAPELGRCRPAP